MRRLTLALVIAALAAPLALRAQDQPEPVTIEVLLGRAAWYVDDFVARFANVVAEEVYVQDSTVPLPAGLRSTGRGALASAMLLGTATHREMKSDFLFVALQGSFDWLPFRDVFEVDDIPIRDREQRLTKLFLQPSADSAEQAERIRTESARYNLGSMKRTINNPVIGLAILQADFQQRFRFTLGKQDPVIGPGVWIVEYRETTKPTLIQGQAGIDLYAEGKLWIEAATGRLMKTEVLLIQPSLKGTVTTSFQLDERLGIAVPIDMRESYLTDTGTQVTARATYDRFRRFDVNVEEELRRDTPAPPVRR